MASIAVLSSILILWCCSTLCLGMSCDACGGDCKPACGTRSFRTCCFNYLKKRSGDPPAELGMRLKLLMAMPELMQYYQQTHGSPALPSPTSSGLGFQYQGMNEQRKCEDYND